MNQLPLDVLAFGVQLIVFKYIHKHRLHTVFEDMRIQLRSPLPYLRTLMIDDCFKRGGIYLIYDKHGLSDWSYPFWYAEYSDYLKK